MNRLTAAVLATFVVILLACGFLAYALRDRPAASGTTATSGAGVTAPAASEKAAQAGNPLLGELFGPDASGLSPSTVASWESTSPRIALRFALAAFLASLLAFRPRRGARITRR